MPRKATTPAKKKTAVKKAPKAAAKPAAQEVPAVYYETPAFMLDLATVESLVGLLENSKLTELELDIGDARLFLSKNGPSMVGGGAPVSYQPAAPVAVAPVAEKKAEVASSNKKLVDIKSPMVGTYYASPSPDADPYVKEGQSIKDGQTLCIIEAMKLMNEIEAEVTGKIVEICVKNGQPVEFDAVLFRVEPSV